MTIQTGLWPLQKGIFQRLSSDTVLSGLVTGVFDSTPINQAYPYITIGEPVADPFTSKTAYGEEVGIVIHTWSQYPGKKETYDLFNAVLASTFSGPMPLDGGFRIIRADFPTKQVIDDIDGRTRHGVMRFRIWIK